MPPRRAAHSILSNGHSKAASEFELRFRRSKRGNLWREFNSWNLTVFLKQGSGLYYWAIAFSDEDVRYSRDGFETEEEAMEALYHELESEL